jgi:hypothetical protein
MIATRSRLQDKGHLPHPGKQKGEIRHMFDFPHPSLTP